MITNKTTLLVVFSYHHHNAAKIAKIFARVLNAEIKSPNQVSAEELLKYTLIGFGSGIYSEKHHKSLLHLADLSPKVHNKKAFLFSTSAVTWDLEKKHASLKKKLIIKGYTILAEFNCKGFNTNSFLKYLGGMNKGHPTSADLHRAELFAQNLQQYI